VGGALVRIQVEDALKESEERFRAIFETAQDSIFIKDRNLRYTQVNPAMERLFGLSSDKIIGRTDRELFGEESGTHIVNVDSRVLNGEIIKEEDTKPVNGRLHTFNVIKVPLSEADGKIIGLCGIARDITERMQAEKEKDELRAQLYQNQKLESIGTLASGVAHEVNNPLQAVRNCLHLAGREDLPEEKRGEYFGLAKTELERLTDTVRRMLDFYRPGKVSPSNVDIEEILGHVLGLMRSQFQKRGVEVKTRIPKNLPPVKAVSAQLQQVFMNLSLNAYDAMPTGGKLEISARKKRKKVEITFQDNGTGISPENQVNIFEPFISTKEKGTGLGLTVSYNIISALGGVLEFVPNEKKGACFRVTLATGGE